MGTKTALRYAVAIFQDWPAVLLAGTTLAHLQDFNSQISILGQLSLFAAPALGAASRGLGARVGDAINKRIDLAFGEPTEALSCSEGTLARQLSRRVEQGCASLTEVLSAWMIPRQALRLVDDVRQGRILLWAELLSPEQEQQAFQVLLETNALRVEVHDLVPVPG